MEPVGLRLDAAIKYSPLAYGAVQYVDVPTTVTVTQWRKVFDVGAGGQRLPSYNGPRTAREKMLIVGLAVASGPMHDDGSDLNWAKIYLRMPEIKRKARSHWTEDSLFSFRRDGGGTSRSWSKLSNPVWIGACGEVINAETCRDFPRVGSKVCRLSALCADSSGVDYPRSIREQCAASLLWARHTHSWSVAGTTTHNVAWSLWRSSQDVSTRSVTIIRNCDDTSRRNVLP